MRLRRAWTRTPLSEHKENFFDDPMARRLYSWTQIAGWQIGEAFRAGELRVLCHRPDCDHVARFRAPRLDAKTKLYEIARLMRCKGCARLGAHFEIWTSDAVGKVRRHSETRS